MFGNKVIKESLKVLVEEHRNILKVVGNLDKECDLINQGKEIDERFFREVIDFIRNYADKFHHMKEEDILFKEFNKCAEEDSGSIHCNPVGQMLIEHNEGRRFVKEMEIALEKNDKKNLIEKARRYASLIREHIFKEDNILYPMADSALNEKIEEKMLEEFKKVAKKTFNIRKNKKQDLNGKRNR